MVGVSSGKLGNDLQAGFHEGGQIGEDRLADGADDLAADLHDLRDLCGELLDEVADALRDLFQAAVSGKQVGEAVHDAGEAGEEVCEDLVFQRRDRRLHVLQLIAEVRGAFHGLVRQNAAELMDPAAHRFCLLGGGVQQRAELLCAASEQVLRGGSAFLFVAHSLQPGDHRAEDLLAAHAAELLGADADFFKGAAAVFDLVGELAHDGGECAGGGAAVLQDGVPFLVRLGGDPELLAFLVDLVAHFRHGGCALDDLIGQDRNAVEHRARHGAHRLERRAECGPEALRGCRAAGRAGLFAFLAEDLCDSVADSLCGRDDLHISLCKLDPAGSFISHLLPPPSVDFG